MKLLKIILIIVIITLILRFISKLSERIRFTHWFETNDFPQSCSPYIREYLKTNRIDKRYFNIDKELLDTIGSGNGLYPPNVIKGLYFKDWKETILEYRKRLLKNCKHGKVYHTSKGTIRIVRIVTNGELRCNGVSKQTVISPELLRFDRFVTVPNEYFRVLKKFGFQFVEAGPCPNGGNYDTAYYYFNIVAYIVL